MLRDGTAFSRARVPFLMLKSTSKECFYNNKNNEKSNDNKNIKNSDDYNHFYSDSSEQCCYSRCIWGLCRRPARPCASSAGPPAGRCFMIGFDGMYCFVLHYTGWASLADDLLVAGPAAILEENW